MYRLQRLIVNDTEIVFRTAKVTHVAGRPPSVWRARLTGLEERQADRLATTLAQPADLEMEDTQGGRYGAAIIATGGLSRQRGALSFVFVALFRVLTPAPAR